MGKFVFFGNVAASTPPSITRRLKVYVGGTWVAKPVKAYIGGQWVEKELKQNL